MQVLFGWNDLDYTSIIPLCAIHQLFPCYMHFCNTTALGTIRLHTTTSCAIHQIILCYMHFCNTLQHSVLYASTLQHHVPYTKLYHVICISVTQYSTRYYTPYTKYISTLRHYVPYTKLYHVICISVTHYSTRHYTPPHYNIMCHTPNYTMLYAFL